MSAKKGSKKSAAMTKTDLVAALAAAGGIKNTQVKDMFDALAALAAKELRAGGTFTIPGLVKITRVNTPAKAARKGTNPFTKEPMTFKAKPAGKKLKVTAIKALKDTAL